MHWITPNCARILEVVSPLWSEYRVIGGYDNSKYPERIYQEHLNPGNIGSEWIRESLIWKYGKWNQYTNGRDIPGPQSIAISRFVASIQLLRSLKNSGNPSLCQQSLDQHPTTSSIFLSHLMFPNSWAIVDQHTVRFLQWVHLQIEDYEVQSSSPWDLSKELNRFQSLLADNLGTTKREMDKFMMTCGRRLKTTLSNSSFRNKKRSIVNKLHLKKIDWVIYFPSKGNEGRQIRAYGVAYRDRVGKTTQRGPRVNLGNVLAIPAIRDGYPHTTGLFLDASGKGLNWTPAYVDCRLVRNESDLLDWIAEIES